MLNPLIRTLVKVAVASLIVGTILAHFGITADQLIKEFGLSYERVEELARRGLSWALPNLLLGALIIVPVWFLLYLFRPPGTQQREAGLDRRRFAAPRLASPARLLTSEAATTPTATTAIMIVQIALISGFTPSRTSE